MHLKLKPCAQSCFSATNGPFPAAQRAVYAGAAGADSSSAPCSLICHRWRGVLSPKPSRSQGQGTCLFILSNHSQHPPLNLPLCLCPCVFPLHHLCISCSLCHLASSLTPSSTHTPFIRLHPRPPTLSLPAAQTTEATVLPVADPAELCCTVCLSLLDSADLD